MDRKSVKLASDASDEKAFVYQRKKDPECVVDMYFDPDETGYSSGHRELLAVKMALEENKEFFEKHKGKVVYWGTDSQNNHIFLRRGSKKVHIQRTAFAVKQLELKYQIKIIPVWMERESRVIEVADEGSKLHLSSDEWSIGGEDLDFIKDTLKVDFDVDAFASYENRKCEVFFSKIPQKEGAGVNFFAQKRKAFI